jgi:formylglycine-generating enzyme required for sulfatase activity
MSLRVSANRALAGCYAVVRGGSFNNNEPYLRASNRNRNGRANRKINNGFRLAQSAHMTLFEGSCQSANL